MNFLYMPSENCVFQEELAIGLSARQTHPSPETLAQIAAEHYYDKCGGWELAEEWESDGLGFWIKTPDADPIEIQTFLTFRTIFTAEIKKISRPAENTGD